MCEFERRHGIKFDPDGKNNLLGVIVDGYWEEGNDVIIVEVWAHVGPAKPSQKKKVLTDVFKMVYIRKKLEAEERNVKSYMVFVDDIAARVLNGLSWGSKAAKEFKVESEVIPLTEAELSLIKKAQKDQDMTQ